MITETEQRALQLAKKVFEHFTHDALPIAREILALEEELGKVSTETAPVAVQPPVNGVKPTSGNAVPKPVSTIRVAPQALNLPAGIMMEANHEPAMAYAGQEDDKSFPF